VEARYFLLGYAPPRAETAASDEHDGMAIGNLRSSTAAVRRDEKIMNEGETMSETAAVRQ
jgi:hypothetical protein